MSPGFGSWQIFLKSATKTPCYKSKTSKVDFIKIDCLCSGKVTSKKEQRQTTEQKMLAIQISEKGLTPEYAKDFFKSLRHLNLKK